MDHLQKLKGEDLIVFSEGNEFEKGFEALPAGIYQLVAKPTFMGSMPAFKPLSTKDKLVKFRTGIIAEVLKKSRRFFHEDTIVGYNELKISHKMGMLFFGKQGTGKTSVCQLVMQELSELYQAVCIDATGKKLAFILATLQNLRKIQDNPIVLFVDEFELAVAREEDQYLTFLDGNDSLGNIIFIACTNYVDSIPERIRNRPSRIKHRFEINSLPLEVYKEYIFDRLPSLGDTVAHEIAFKASDKGLTIDQVKHVLIDVRIDKAKIDDAIENVMLTVGEEED